jgi:hypothetical protein
MAINQGCRYGVLPYVSHISCLPCSPQNPAGGVRGSCQNNGWLCQPNIMKYFWPMALEEFGVCGIVIVSESGMLHYLNNQDLQSSLISSFLS